MKQQSAFLLNILLAAAAFSLFSKQTYALAAMNSFTSGQAAVAADVNTNFTTLYNALTNATNSINVDGWANASGNLGYTGGNIGVGIASPLAKFQVSGGSAVALTAGTGFGVFGVTTSNHIAIDTTQIQAKSNGTTANSLRLNPLGGNVGIGIATPTEKLHVSNDIAIDGAEGGFRLLYFKTADSSRWAVTANNTGESGSNVGSDFTIRRYSDAGGFISTPLFIRRSDGEVGIGTSNPAAKLHVNGVIRTDNDVQLDGADGSYKTVVFMTAGGSRWHVGVSNTAEGGGSTGSNFNIRSYNNSGAFIETPFSITRSSGNVSIPNALSVGSCTGCSDARLKKNIYPLENNLAKLMLLRSISFEWRKPEERPFAEKVTLPVGKRQLGLLAQEVEQIFPSLVTANKDYYGIRSVNAEEVKTINYHGLIGPIIGAVQELKSEKDTQVLALEKRATAAETRAAKLEKILADEQMARKQQEIRLAQLEVNLQRMAKRLDGQVVARR